MTTITAPVDKPIERRTVQIREVDADKREVSGVAVPWGQVADIAGLYREQVERGAVQDSEDALAFYLHDKPVGKITRAKDADEGWEITMRLSETPAGDEAYTLARDGVLSHFSIGFQPVEHRDEIHDDGSITRTRTRIKVREVSLVPFPAYEGATVTQVREAQNKKEEPIVGDTTAVSKADLDEVRTGMEDLTRKVETSLSTLGEAEQPVEQFRSFGEYVKAVASGDERALRAYTGAVTGDTVMKDAWIGNLVRLISERQRVRNIFQTGALPAEGMGVEYAVLKSDTTQVGVQAAEGDDLLYGKVAITTERAPVKTLGGWTSLSRQAIERASVGILDTTFQAMALKYGKAVEILARQALTAGITAADQVQGDLTTQDGVILALLDLVEHFEDVGQNFTGLLVAKDVFQGLLAVEATDRILQVTQAPTDKVGTVTVRSLEGNIAGVPVTYVPSLGAGTTVAYDSTAIRTLESPGAPLRLQDENIVNLTKDFSVYGYAASFVQVPAGLVSVVAEIEEEDEGTG